VLLAAAYLHDIVAFEKNDAQRADASRLAAEKSSVILTKLGFPPEKLDAVMHAVEAHSFSAQIQPRTIEAEILQDADRLDTLGAIGLARIFHVGGRIGAELFHEDDPLAQHRQLDDAAYSLDHFHTKILGLPDRMNTEPGRELARLRMHIIEQFLECLLAEIGSATAAGPDEKRA
ncbi:MAG: HD domain-containing protein, partial [Rhodomicrobiaceae bacterium]